ncbi:hypothetical protein Pmani_016300 [Petrolisthes manimaculis]|uniref:Uncharacterized protein n=1 Tax=Petrolisthes manimaculis TaxID=1843537 RepID=A0AAE1U6U7_9EUCA|nr:hypothetical protein Pmani_016300 [Petrolisthes manimaculis]
MGEVGREEGGMEGKREWKRGGEGGMERERGVEKRRGWMEGEKEESGKEEMKKGKREVEKRRRRYSK